MIAQDDGSRAASAAINGHPKRTLPASAAAPEASC